MTLRNCLLLFCLVGALTLAGCDPASAPPIPTATVAAAGSQPTASPQAETPSPSPTEESAVAVLPTATQAPAQVELPTATPPPNWLKSASIEGDYYLLGNPAAPVRLVDYSDFF